MTKVEELVEALKAVELENVKEELISMTKLNELLKKNLGKNLVNRLNFISKRKKLKKESINSKKRFTYSEVNKIVEEQDPETIEKNKES